MITIRGWWFLLIVLFLVTITLLTSSLSVGMVSLTLLCWMLGALFHFACRSYLPYKGIKFEREISDDVSEVTTLWVGRSYDVRIRVHCNSLLPTSYVQISDRVPPGAEIVSGQSYVEGYLSAQSPMEIRYRIHCPHIGVLRFEGIKVQFSDLQGLFYLSRFIRMPREFRVLPAFADARGNVPVVKEYNLLPLAGSHRYRLAGSGSELLDLRDYMPGDPPKTIAWKVSARRDRLITKVFESEVPIRCVLFVDVSQSVRVGPQGNNALAREVEIASALAQAAAGNRDLPGLCLFDENGVSKYLLPARNKRHVIQILQHLANAASLFPTTKKADLRKLLPLGFHLASEIYPELMNHTVNSFPWWLPFWAPKRKFRPSSGSFWKDLVYSVSDFLVNFLLFFLIFFGRFSLIRHLVVTAFSSGKRNRYRWRKQLACLLAYRYGLMPGGAAHLEEDDSRMSLYLQRFLAEHQVSYPFPLYDKDGKYLFSSPQKVEILAKAILNSVSRGKDNELYVLLVDLLEIDDQLDSLVKAVKVALARHHQVVLIIAWPKEIPLPREKSFGNNPLSSLDRLAQIEKSVGSNIGRLLAETTATRLQQSYQRIRLLLGKLGVQVLCAGSRDAVQLILDRLEQMRRQRRGTP